MPPIPSPRREGGKRDSTLPPSVQQATRPSPGPGPCAYAGPVGKNNKVSSKIKVIALSYLYIFDPVIRTAFLKNLETQLKNIILIVDEAHNLPETAINISSRSLSQYVLKQAEKEAIKFGNKDIAL